MSLDAVMFAKFFAGAGGIEITEGNKFELMNLFVPEEHFLEHQFGFAVGIDRALWEVFGHGNFVGRTVSGAGGAENKFFDVVLDGGIEEVQAAGNVVAKIFARIGHGFADEGVGGEMNYGGGFGLANCAANRILIGQIALDEFGAGIHGAAMAFGQIIKNGHLMGGVEQFLDAN